LRCGRTVWLQLRGILNWRTADQFRESAEAWSAGSCRRLIIDLTGTDYVGGNGLHALIDLQERLTERGIELRVVAPDGSRCARSFALAQLDTVIRTFTGLARAWRHGRRRICLAPGWK
jgi:anti-anti-sigma factor